MLSEVNQVDDYWWRGDALSDMCFYDFVRCVKKVKRGAKPVMNRLGTYARHPLVAPHPQHKSHELVHHTDAANLNLRNELIPRVIGCSIPRRASDWYPLFAYTHFVPWSSRRTVPEQLGDEDLESFMRGYDFERCHLKIMNNWEEIHECADERDAERLRKREAVTKEARMATKAVFDSLEDITDVDLDRMQDSAKENKHNVLIRDALKRLNEAEWFAPRGDVGTQPPSALPSVGAEPVQIPVVTDAVIKQWEALIGDQEKLVVAKRRNALDPSRASETRGKVAETVAPGPSPILEDTGSESVAPTISLSISSESVRSCETPKQVLERIGREHCLNDEQFIAYRIAAMRFLEVFDEITSGKPACEDQSRPEDNTLRMMMTGPGGTGKTHVIRALTALMKVYGCAHRIRFLAPTGSAASLIEGMTIHSGLGIQVRKSDKGKGNRRPGESNEDYSVVISARKRDEIRAEWMHVLFLLVDEVSMMSLQLLCELDHALRYAKESSKWFGGINIIFSGDFYQFPPVMGAPLYRPIQSHLSQSNDELKARLGRLAWKTLNAVVRLNKQMRMAKDPEFGDAVMRYRKRESTILDVDLFNSRVVKSSDNPNGISMAQDGNLDAAIIVRTNVVRHALNSQKARSEVSMCPENLIVCAAKDMVGDAVAIGDMQDALLRMNVLALHNDAALPGFVSFYVGMPVVLRFLNVSTNLRIANGSQGTIVHITTEVLNGGHLHAKCILVHFEDSPVQLPGFPIGVFPIRPHKWHFNTLLTDDSAQKRTVSVKRFQMPLQPAFAVTGHFSQGKTLPKVLVDLRENATAGYVGASRARSRQGLLLPAPVCLSDLRKPLNEHLVNEEKRLDAMAINTLIRYRFSAGDYVMVPEPEFEQRHVCEGSKLPGPAPFATELLSPPKKRKAADEALNTGEDRKRLKRSPPISCSTRGLVADIATGSLPSTLGTIAPCMPQRESCLPNAPGTLRHVFPKWDSVNYSCAYDSAFAVCLSAFSQNGVQWRAEFASGNYYMGVLAELLVQVLRQEVDCSIARDQFRDCLSSSPYATWFPRWGPAMIGVDKIFAALGSDISIEHRLRCLMCGHSHSYSTSFTWVCRDQLWNALAADVGFNPAATSASFMTWFRLCVQQGISARQVNQMACPACGQTSWGLDFSQLMRPPPMLAIEIAPNLHPHPLISPTLEFSQHPTGPVPSGDHAVSIAKYVLSGVIYHGAHHFTTRTIDQKGQVWSYDGQVSALPTFEGPASTVDYLFSNGRQAIIFIYVRSS